MCGYWKDGVCQDVAIYKRSDSDEICCRYHSMAVLVSDTVMVQTSDWYEVKEELERYLRVLEKESAGCCEPCNIKHEAHKEKIKLVLLRTPKGRFDE